MTDQVDQHAWRVQIDDLLYLRDLDGLKGLQQSVNVELDDLEDRLTLFEKVEVAGEGLSQYLGVIRQHWSMCQVMAYLLFRRQQEERDWVRQEVEAMVDLGSLPSAGRALFLTGLVTADDRETAERLLMVMRGKRVEFHDIRARWHASMQKVPIRALYEAEPMVERVSDALAALENDIRFLELQFKL